MTRKEEIVAVGVLTKQGKHADALVQINNMIEGVSVADLLQSEETCELLYLQGVCLLNTGQAERAAEILDALIQHRDSDRRLYFPFGLAQQQLGNNKLAIQGFKRGAELGNTVCARRLDDLGISVPPKKTTLPSGQPSGKIRRSRWPVAMAISGAIIAAISWVAYMFYEQSWPKAYSDLLHVLFSVGLWVGIGAFIFGTIALLFQLIRRWHGALAQEPVHAAPRHRPLFWYLAGTVTSALIAVGIWYGIGQWHKNDPAPPLNREFLTSHSWQFLHGEGDVIAPWVQLDPSGTIHGVKHPNESRWGLEDGKLVFYHSNGEAATRFAKERREAGKVVLSGRLLMVPDDQPVVIHVLKELGPLAAEKNASKTSLLPSLTREFLTSHSWQFLHGEGDVIAPWVQLDPSGTIHGVKHPNESRWGLEDGKLVFYHSNGEAATRFAKERREAGKVVLSGRLLMVPDDQPVVIHVLKELGPLAAEKNASKTSLLPSLTREFLTSRSWQFLHGKGDIISPWVQLHPSGAIRGVDHPNESRWGLEDGKLVFYHLKGEAATRFAKERREAGKVVLSGRLLVVPDDQPVVIHVLKELEPLTEQ